LWYFEFISGCRISIHFLRTSASGKTETKSKIGSNLKHKKTGTDMKTVKGSKNTKNAEPKNARFFKAIDNAGGPSIGRYTGGTPKQAASKAFTKMVRKMKALDGKVPKQPVKLYIKESTRRGPQKMYAYSASRNKLKVPQELIITDKMTGEEKKITYRYRNNIRKIPLPSEMIGGAKKYKANKKTDTKSGSKSSSKSGSKSVSKSGSKSGSKSVSKSGSKTSSKVVPKPGSKKVAEKKVIKKNIRY